VALAAAVTVVASSAVAAVFDATPARAAGISYVQGTAFATGTSVTSLPVQLTSSIGGGDLLVGWFSEYNAPGQVTVSDSVNGAWTRGPSALSYASGGDIALYYLANSQAAPGGLTVTVGAPAAASLGGSVAEYSGVALSGPLDQMAVASSIGTAVDSGATAPAAAGDLVFGALVTGGSPQGVTPGSSNGVAYTTRASTGSGSAYAEDITSATAGSQHGTATLTASTDWYAVAAAFSAVPQSAQPPSGPTNVTAPSATSSHVTLSWTASTDNVPVTGYTVYRNGAQIGTTATTGYNDTTVAPSTTYSYTVTASNGAAQTSPPSSPLTVTTPVTPPASITFVQSNTVSTGTQVPSTTMQLTHPVGAGDLLVGWFSLYSATGKLQVSDTLNGAWMRGPSSLSFQNDSGDIALYYKENSKAAPAGVTITVATTSGTGYLTGVAAEYSDVALAGALDQMTTARAISASIDTGLTGPANATELVYSAAMIDTPAGFTQTITPGSSQGVAFTPRAQTSNISAYEQDITAPASGPQHGAAGLGASADWYAATVVFRQLPAGATQAPTVPTGLSAPSIASTRVSLSWSPASDASTPVTGYTVYRNGTSIGITASNSTTFIDVSTAPSTTYTYTVDAFNGTGQHAAQSAGLSVATPANSPQFIQGTALSLATRQTSLNVVLPKPVLAGDLLMGWYGQYNVPGQLQVSDNVNGAWVRSSSTETFQGNGDIALEYVQNAKAAPNGITITVSVPPGSNAYLQEVIAQFRGVSTNNALDQAVVAESNQGSSISAGPTAAVPAGELVVGAVITGGQPGNVVPGSSAGVPYIVDAQNGSASSDLEDVLSSTAGPQSANATLGVGGDWYMVVATFRPLTLASTTTYVLDGFGGLHPYGAASAVSVTAYWPGWNIARGIALDTCAGQSGGYVLDGFGGVHPFGGAPAAAVTAYWPGWDIARGIAATCVNGSPGGYVLDGFGGVHPFGGAPAVAVTAYWSGWDIARGIVLQSGGQGGYVLDGFGAVHPFGGAPAVAVSAYWPGWNIARGLVLSSATSGYVLDGFGGVHPFGGAPAVAVTAYWSGRDIARGIVLQSGGPGGYVLDGFGGVHPFGGAPAVTITAYWSGWDIARGISP
jgi:chitodextrinase